MTGFSQKGEHNTKTLLSTFGIILFLIAFVLLVLFFMKGQTTTKGEFPEDVVSEAIACSSKSIQFPYFTYDNSIGKEMKVNVIFENNNISSISLIYDLKYDNESKSLESYNINHSALNTYFGQNSLESDALGAVFANLGSEMKLSLYASGDELNVNTAKFFMVPEGVNLGAGIEILMGQYEKSGFTCRKL